LRAAIYREVEHQPARKAVIDPHATDATEAEGVT